ncbi:MAG: glycolate oxidase subunit GlcF, partial [Limnohabitans sp.]
IVDAKVPRPAPERALRWALKEGLPSPLFGPAMKLGQLVRPLLPAALKAKVPVPQPSGDWPRRTHPRKVLLLAGCVQPAMSPNINSATARVLDACGIQTIVEPLAGCCGGVKFHLNDQDAAHVQMKNNIDAWWPHLGQGVEAIVMNASGCGVTVKDYGHIFRNDPLYAEKARRISELTKDLSELLPGLVPQLQKKLQTHKAQQQGLLAFHPPCTLQHGQQLKGGVETHLGALGFKVRVTSNEAHLCCGSAGTYSVLQPTIATQLRDRKLGNLNEMQPQAILSANIGCITHLQSGTALPVRHWVEALDSALS